MLHIDEQAVETGSLSDHGHFDRPDQLNTECISNLIAEKLLPERVGYTDGHIGYGDLGLF